MQQAKSNLNEGGASSILKCPGGCGADAEPSLVAMALSKVGDAEAHAGCRVCGMPWAAGLHVAPPLRRRGVENFLQYLPCPVVAEFNN